MQSQPAMQFPQLPQVPGGSFTVDLIEGLAILLLVAAVIFWMTVLCASFWHVEKMRAASAKREAAREPAQARREPAGDPAWPGR
jgi:hypothetical protein